MAIGVNVTCRETFWELRVQILNQRPALREGHLTKLDSAIIPYHLSFPIRTSIRQQDQNDRTKAETDGPRGAVPRDLWVNSLARSIRGDERPISGLFRRVEGAECVKRWHEKQKKMMWVSGGEGEGEQTS
ncbi:hypothetical protein PoB_002423100 [Plakobranchus ocellatus]|uniref:Uncharacterized protein n=1 Tax=Plakobranchus ocellatus TaxID=259542 RepID=A0AAV3ZP65_9GAST|nr:hypothetical protein PoB_002423100 [Plakobranchus ocellatus]